MSSTPIIDLHVHSTLKPYGNSFYSNTNKRSINSSACVWFRDKFTLTDEHNEIKLGVTRYRQADFRTVSESQHHIICVSLYPIEKGFATLKKGSIAKKFDNFIIDFASQLGKNRIDDIKSDEYNYFNDFKKEFGYLMELNNQVVENGYQKYRVINELSYLDSASSLLVIPTVEGGHFLCEGNDPRIADSYKNIEVNIKNLKDNPNPLFFVTLAHHFFNGLCTHAKSLYGTSGSMLDQKYGMRENGYKHEDEEKPITVLGKKTIDLLLSKENGPRILIDIKHMSKEARNAYYTILESDEYKTKKIPIIYSHGALNISDSIQVNLDYEDVYKIYKSDGIIGIEIDQRILGYSAKGMFKKLGKLIKLNSKQKRAYKDAYYFWRQIIAIAEFAHGQGFKDPWKCIALGSDYDGIINPLDSFRDSSSISMLYLILIEYLDDYWSDTSAIPKKPNVDASDIIFQIMYKNAYNFIKTHYLEPLVDRGAIV